MTALAMGFRPFFVLAGVAATLLVPAWLVALSGHGTATMTPFWHAHELVHGFVGAVLGGFFLTAVPKWTSTKPLSGAPLAGLVALWLLGRVVQLVPGLPSEALLLDTAYVLALAVAIGIPIVKSSSTRNLGFPVLLLVMAAADAWGHLDVGASWTGHRVAALAEVGIVVIFGGRITPLFTRNALRGIATVRERGRIDDLAIASAVALVPLALTSWSEVTAGVAALAAVANGLRMRGWATKATIGRPLLWVLHTGYAWVPLSLAAWSLAHLRPDVLAPSTALHAATVGVLGTYTLGMMSRVALGHTGRPLRALPGMKVAYLAVLASGLLRVAGPAMTSSVGPLHGAGALWTLAFAIFTVVYTPVLLRPRIDGKPG